MRELSVDLLTDTQQGEAEVLSTLPGWVSKYASLAFWTGWDAIILKVVGAGRDSNMCCITMLDSCCLKYI
jgi:hypothetical protein